MEVIFVPFLKIVLLEVFEFLYYQQVEVFAGLIKELKIFRVLLQVVSDKFFSLSKEMSFPIYLWNSDFCRPDDPEAFHNIHFCWSDKLSVT